jgi:hypothetical protein
MSLLLLFNNRSIGWTNAGTSSTTWVRSHYDMKNIWSEWQGYTWGSIASSGYTWGNLAGFTFTNTTGNSTTWTRV